VDVSASGCFAVVGADLPLHRRVRIICTENGRAAEGQVVWRGHEAWDIGIALTKPDPSFWGVPVEAAGIQKHEEAQDSVGSEKGSPQSLQPRKGSGH
jgi:hypothetical protein